MVQLTIITPIYNRAALLETCYHSLAQQTCMDFEWIIVDDGSTDDTEAVVRGLQERERRFEIVYFRKENGGKHTALNASHPYIRGRYILILDSDDTLTEDAVEQALGAWARWERESEVGIVTLLKGRDQAHPNCYAAEENVPVDVLSYPRVCPVSNDACEVIRTELFLRYPFPVFEGERFLAETALWGRVGHTHKCVYVNRVIYLCNYLEGGLTKAGRAMRIRNPRGGMYNANLYMEKKNPVKVRFKNGLLYTAYGFFASMRPKEMAGGCTCNVLMWSCLPLGWMLYRFWKHRYRERNHRFMTASTEKSCSMNGVIDIRTSTAQEAAAAALPFLSVIIPVYNYEKFVRRAAESVLSQPCADRLELILVDDGSTDRSGAVCDRIVQAHSNAGCIHKKNGGLSAARNTGMDAAKGKYIAFLDADDWWQAGVFSKALIAELEKYDADLVRFRFRQVSISGRYAHTIRFREGFFNYEPPEAKAEFGVSFCANYFFKRELCEENRIRFSPVPMGEDGLFTHLFLCYARTVFSLPVLLQNYWMNSRSMLHKAGSFHRYECREISLAEEERLFRARGIPCDNRRLSLSYLVSDLPTFCAELPLRDVKERLTRDSCKLIRQEEIQPWTRFQKPLRLWKRHPFLFWLKSRINPGIPTAVKRLLLRSKRTYGLSDLLQYRVLEHWEVLEGSERSLVKMCFQENGENHANG